MTTAFLNSSATHNASQVPYVGLLNASQVELNNVGYVRLAANWLAADNGVVRPTSDLDFSLVTGVTVGYWAGFAAASGGSPLLIVPVPSFTAPTAYKFRLLASATGLVSTIING